MIDEKFDAKMEEYHAWRGVDYPCEECQGSGKKVYGSTATFWGGIGGAAMTTSVCDKCWGSGDKYRLWKSWKLIAEELKERAPLYGRLRIAVWKVIQSYKNDGNGKPPTFDRPEIGRAWGEVTKIMNLEK